MRPSRARRQASHFPTRLNHGGGLKPSASNDGISIMRSTMEFPDELLSKVDAAGSPDVWPSYSTPPTPTPRPPPPKCPSRTTYSLFPVQTLYPSPHTRKPRPSRRKANPRVTWTATSMSTPPPPSDYLPLLYMMSLPFASESNDIDCTMDPRTSKRSSNASQASDIVQFVSHAREDRVQYNVSDEIEPPRAMVIFQVFVSNMLP